MAVKCYKKFKPYGKLLLLTTKETYFLLMPVPLEQHDEWGMQYWSVVKIIDYVDPVFYSGELNAWLYNEALTLIVHPTNIAVELSDNMHEIYYWTGEYIEEEEEEADVDVSEGETPPVPEYLLDKRPIP